MADGSAVPFSGSPSWDSPTTHFVKYCAEIRVPPGAVSIQVKPEIDRCVGKAEFEGFGLEEIPGPAKWILTFDDEFNGAALDSSKWTASVGNADWQKSYYSSAFSPNNITFGNGYMRIHAEKKAGAGMPYTSAEIMTLGKFAQTYGCIEARIRMPRAMGTWPAVYMIPYDDTWPPEIDIAEATGRWPTTRMVNNHWKDQDGLHLQWAGTFDDANFDLQCRDF